MSGEVILGLAAAIAWVSLVTVEFYERIYRSRIQGNVMYLQIQGEDERYKLSRDIQEKADLTPKQIVQRGDRITQLENAQNILTSWRTWIFRFLFFAMATSLFASYAPDYVIYKAPEFVFTALLLDYLALGLVFFLGLVFLFKMFWYDGEIMKISRLRRPQLCPKCNIPMPIVANRLIGKWRCERCGEEVEFPLSTFKKIE